MTARRTATGADIVVATTLRAAWPSLPALLVGSVALCAAATAPVLVSPGLNAIAILLYAALGAPALAALAALGNALAGDEPATVAGWWSALRQHAGFALRHGLLAAIPAELLLAAVHVWTRGHPPWVLPSLALTGAATVLATCGLLAVLTLGTARPGLRGAVLWVTALHVVARRPSRFAAVLCLSGLGVWGALRWSASVLLLVPAPATLVLAAAVWATVAELTTDEEDPCGPS